MLPSPSTRKLSRPSYPLGYLVDFENPHSEFAIFILVNSLVQFGTNYFMLGVSYESIIASVDQIIEFSEDLEPIIRTHLRLVRPCLPLVGTVTSA